MTIGFFPPTSVYPTGIDSDYTLFLVHNTTETTLTANNQAWSEEILITPQPQGSNEIWPYNGFATIEGELLYYDDVDLNAYGMVYKLKRCLRSIGGRPTQFNAAGTWIRGFVIAEHHIQLVNCILNIENFVGYNFTPDKTTLDWRIRNLQAEPVIFDDVCPDVEFDFTILSQDANTGTQTQFLVKAQGVTGSVQVQFGDGTSTTALSGTHTYAPNATIDPVMVVTSGDCQTIQTPVQRPHNVSQLPPVTAPPPPFTVPIPIPAIIPSFVFPNPQIPSVNLSLPPIVIPNIDLGPLNIPSQISIVPSNALPSIISFSPVNIPSTISFTPTLSIPTTITFTNVPSFTAIQFAPAPSFVIATFAPSPSFQTVQFGPPPSFTCVPFCVPSSFPLVQFGPAPSFVIATFAPSPSFAPIMFSPAPSFSPILFGPAPSFAPINFGPAPFVSVIWGTPPTIGCSCTITCPTSSPFAMAPGFGMDADPNFGGEVEVQYDVVDFPTEIKIVPPKIPPIEIKHDIPSVVRLEAPKFEDIRIIGPDIALPSEIRIIPPDVNTMISVISFALPESIRLDAQEVPTSIEIEFPDKLPEIKVDASGIPETIKVVGVPEVIRLEHTLPSIIKAELEVPKDLKIPLVFEGPPLTAEVKINWGFEKVLEGIEEPVCFSITPCKRN